MPNSKITATSETTSQRHGGKTIYTSDGADGQHTGTYYPWRNAFFENPDPDCHYNDNEKSDSYGKYISNDGWHVAGNVWKLKPGTARQRKEKQAGKRQDAKDRKSTSGETKPDSEDTMSDSNDTASFFEDLLSSEQDFAHGVGAQILGSYLGIDSTNDAMTVPPTVVVTAPSAPASTGLTDDEKLMAGGLIAAILAIALLR